MGIELRLDGIEETVAMFDLLANRMQNQIVRDAADKAIQIVLPAAQATCPVYSGPDPNVEPGALRDSIHIERLHKSGWQGACVSTGSFTTTGKYTEYTGHTFYGAFQELGTRHQPARPFLRPALDENTTAIIEAMTRAIADAIEQTPPGLSTTDKYAGVGWHPPKAVYG